MGGELFFFFVKESQSVKIIRAGGGGTGAE